MSSDFKGVVMRIASGEPSAESERVLREPLQDAVLGAIHFELVCIVDVVVRQGSVPEDAHVRMIVLAMIREADAEGLEFVLEGVWVCHDNSIIMNSCFKDFSSFPSIVQPDHLISFAKALDERLNRSL